MAYNPRGDFAMAGGGNPRTSTDPSLTVPQTFSSDPTFGLNTANQINAQNLAYVRGGQATDPTAAMTANLLNPNWAPMLYDTGEASAEDAVNRGISGSNLANFRGSRMYSDQLTKNALTASQLLTGATNRLPTPSDPNRNITSPYQSSELGLQQEEITQKAQLQKEAEDAAYQRALLGGRGGHFGGGGGAGLGASVSDPNASVPYGGGYPGAGGGGAVDQGAVDEFGNPVGLSTMGPLSAGYGFGDTTGGGGDWWNQDLFGAGGGSGAFDSIPTAGATADDMTAYQ